MLLSMDGYYNAVTHSRRVCQSKTSWIFWISQPTSVRVSFASTNLCANVLVACHDQMMWKVHIAKEAESVSDAELE